VTWRTDPGVECADRQRLWKIDHPPENLFMTKVARIHHPDAVVRRPLTRGSACPLAQSLVVGAFLLTLAGCAGQSSLQIAAGTGPRPALPAPRPGLFPTVHIAPAVGWANGATPVAGTGLQVTAFATALDHPRWIHVLPNGDVLVAETNAPPRPDNGRGIKGRIMTLLMKRAGAGVASADRITLFRDTTGNGVADLKTTFLAGLHSPFGMALVGDRLYIANTDAVLEFPYIAGDTQITAPGRPVVALPAGPINHHWTKNLLASPDGRTLYVTVGSNSNVGESGMTVEAERAAIWAVDPQTGAHRLFASGLRNPNGLAWEPSSGTLWAVVNERDELGSDLVPDYLTSVREGAFYGWPFSYYGQHVDGRVKPPRPDLVASALVPDYALGPHTAALGLAWSAGTSLPAAFATGMFVGRHGSWNRRPRSGYDVIFVPFRGARPSGLPVEVLTSFVDSKGRAHGRPVGVALDSRGALLVADDVGNIIWRVTPALAP
jgi:glucose/arabinose dehydrogenase